MREAGATISVAYNVSQVPPRARPACLPQPATACSHLLAQLVIIVAFVLVEHFYFQRLAQRLHYTRLYATRA